MTARILIPQVDVLPGEDLYTWQRVALGDDTLLLTGHVEFWYVDLYELGGSDTPVFSTADSPSGMFNRVAIFDELQAGEGWDQDPFGWNVRAFISGKDDFAVIGGRAYRAEWTLTRPAEAGADPSDIVLQAQFNCLARRG
ncbi:MAG: hypothetical protein B7733_06185 [Myxococcales bacterium FL481]|nr:MAG: hypothetical protein B7733_06185 [Myxococcales bacterium FL481]